MTKPEAVLAVTKAIAAKEAKEAREALDPGVYPVDALVRVTGSLKVGEDYEQSITLKVGPLDLWMATLDLLAPQVSEALVERIVARAMDRSEESLRRFETLKKATEPALEAVRGVTKTTCKGKVTTALRAEFIEAEVTVPAAEPVLIVPK